MDSLTTSPNTSELPNATANNTLFLILLNMFTCVSWPHHRRQARIFRKRVICITVHLRQRCSAVAAYNDSASSRKMCDVEHVLVVVLDRARA